MAVAAAAAAAADDNSISGPDPNSNTASNTAVAAAETKTSNGTIHQANIHKRARTAGPDIYEPLPKKVCNQCSRLCDYRVQHRHFSGIRNRLQGGGDFFFNCESCFSSHRRDIEGRLRLHVTSSTLHSYWRNGQSGPLEASHIDHIAVSGADVPSLRLVCEADLRYVEQPIDVVLTGGCLNSISKGRNGGEVILELLDFEKMVKSHNPANSFVAATVPFAPQFCPSLVPIVPPRDSYCNDRIDDLITVNAFIRSKWEAGPQLHTLGLMTNPKMFQPPSHLLRHFNCVNPLL